MRFILSVLILALTTTLAAALPSFPLVQIDQFGNGIAVWQEFDSDSTLQIYSSTFTASAGTWGTPVQVSDGQYASYNPQLHMNSAGNAVALWVESIGNRVLMVSTYTVGGSWSSPVMLSTLDQLLSDNYSVVLNPSGTAIAIWCVFLSAETTQNYSSTAILGGSWSTPVAMPDPNGSNLAKSKDMKAKKPVDNKKKKPTLLSDFQQLLNMIF
jgi:hypothetical protein